MSDTALLSASPATLSCDPVYRALVRAAREGDETALAACSDYRQERGLPPLQRGQFRWRPIRPGRLG